MNDRRYNICIFQPHGHTHSRAFQEIAESIYYSLRELGFEADFRTNEILPRSTNIVIGCHLLDHSWIGRLPKSSIILNTEQLGATSMMWNDAIRPWVENFPSWDYSESNIAYLHGIGVKTVRRLKIGFQKELVRIPRTVDPDIDVLFYGSVNDRRRTVLEGLSARGLNVKSVFGVYGEARDRLISRSKVVLNLHFYDTKIFEVIRVFYLMINSVAVVGEVGPGTAIDPMFAQGVYRSGYDGLVESCAELVENEPLRRDQERRAFEAIRAFPQSRFTAEVL